MRALILTLALQCSAFFCFSQTYQNQSKLIDFLGQEKFNSISQSNPAYLEFLDARLTYGVKLIDFADGKMDHIEKIENIPYRITATPKDTTKTCKNGVGKDAHTAEQIVSLYQQGELNILQYILKYDRSAITYYLLGNTGKVLVLYPVEYINKKSVSQ